MVQMICSDEAQKSSEEIKLSACSLNAPHQNDSPDLTVPLQLSVCLLFFPAIIKLTVHSLISFHYKGLPLL